MQQLGREFEHDFGIKVRADATENIPNNFPLTEKSLMACQRLKPIGIPGLTSLYDEMAKTDVLLWEMEACADAGEVCRIYPRWAASGVH
jgi:hypothetical protein